jgi:hypothetical protein
MAGLSRGQRDRATLSSADAPEAGQAYRSDYPQVSVEALFELVYADVLFRGG